MDYLEPLKYRSGTDASNSTKPKNYRKEYSMDSTILNHPIKTWQPHPKLEFGMDSEFL